MSPTALLAWHREVETDGDEYAAMHTRVYHAATPPTPARATAPGAIVATARRPAAPAHDSFALDSETERGLPGVAIRIRNDEPPAPLTLMGRQAD